MFINLLILQTIFKNAENQVTAAIFKACQCCLACFEGFIQYLTSNAYIIISMDGSSFCIAGKRAYLMLSKNTLRVFAINSIGDFVLLLGKVFCVVATVLIAIEMIQVCNIIFMSSNFNTSKLPQNTPALHHPSAPIIVCGVFAFLVSHCFLTVFEMTIDTIFLCFCEDCERHDGINK
jgi:solute carrier family 44 (choline transporter-like protein), member 1